MNLTFVETKVFTARWHQRLDDEALRQFQNELLENPQSGDSIPGCPILRKMRFGDTSRGKGRRGGVRVIYLHTPEVHRIDLITVYGKDESDDLTRDEMKALCELARLLRREQAKTVARPSKRNRKGR